MMWRIIILFAFCNILFKSNSEELDGSNFQTAADDTSIYQGVNRNETGAFDEGSHNLPSLGLHGPLNEISDQPMMFPDEWRPLVIPINFNPYPNSQPSETDSKQLNDHDIQKYFPQPPNPDSEQDVQSLNTSSGTAYISQTFDDFMPYPQTSISYPQNQFMAEQLNPLMTYPAAVSINIRRSFASNAPDLQNSSESTSKPTASEPTYSSIEHRFTGFLPSLPFHNIRTTPNQVSPFWRYNYQRPSYFPAAFSYPPPYGMIPPIAINPLTTVTDGQPQFSPIDRESEISNSPLAREKERPLLTETIPVTQDAPRRVAAGFYLSPMINSQNFQLPFIIPRPVLPTIIPRPVSSRFLPAGSPLIPGQTSIPINLNVPEVQSQSEDRIPPVINDEQLVPATLQPIGDKMQIDEQQIPYMFGYVMNDGNGTDQHRMESSDFSGTVRGSYGYRDSIGVYRLVNYMADENGFRAFVKSNEPGVSSSGSADVIVKAEQPSPVTESLTVTKSEPVILSDENADLIAEGSEISK